jgi:hypothetical protein
MAEAFVRTIKRDYARINPLPDAHIVIKGLPVWFDHYNAVHPHSALRYRSPREFIAAQSNQEVVSGISGAKQLRGCSSACHIADRLRPQNAGAAGTFCKA